MNDLKCPHCGSTELLFEEEITRTSTAKGYELNSDETVATIYVGSGNDDEDLHNTYFWCVPCDGHVEPLQGMFAMACTVQKS